MNLLIRSGLIGGAIGGEAMVLLVLVNTILLRSFAQGNLIEMQPWIVMAWGIAYPLLVILVFEAGGIFSSWLCRAHLHSGKEALLPGIIAGITIGIILEIMWIANILSLAAHAAQGTSGFFMGYDNSLMLIFFLIILVVMGSVLSAFGSFIFSRRSIGE
ncbi:MAG: hypothetical protein M0Q92_02100 [Methanoregula sp.]|jgi:hypothetical protein|nr:hypothetical protein [Methanoregula sp.]